MRWLLGFVGMCAIVAACSSSDSSNATTATLATDAHDICVVPSTSAQDVVLPSTGGITGKLSFGAFAAGVSGCDEVRIATGSSIEGLSTSSLKIRDNAAPVRPILTISLGEGIDGNPLFGAQAIVTGMTLNTGSNVNFPDGTYYMTVTRVSGTQQTRVDTIQLTAANGVLTVAAITVPTTVAASGQFPVITIANTSSILAVYPRGVTPPTVTNDTDSPPRKVDVSDAGLPKLPTDPPTPGPSNPGAYGLPPPAPGQTIGYSAVDWSDGCTNGNPGCQLSHPIVSPDFRVDAPAGMNGSIEYETNLAYMQLLSVTFDGCPSEWDINAGLDGNGTIGIPASKPLAGVNCIIKYSTLPPNGSGSYYEVDLIIRPLDIGDVGSH